MTDQDSAVTVGATICITMELTRMQTEVDSGVRSPRMRVVEIRRDASGVLELVVVRADEPAP